jgi:hypothetical protein
MTPERPKWIDIADTVPAGDPMWAIHEESSITQAFSVRHATAIRECSFIVHAVRGNGNDGGYIAISLHEMVASDDPPAEPEKPYRLSENDRRFLRSLKIDPADHEPPEGDEDDGA